MKEDQVRPSTSMASSSRKSTNSTIDPPGKLAFSKRKRWCIWRVWSKGIYDTLEEHFTYNYLLYSRLGLSRLFLEKIGAWENDRFLESGLKSFRNVFVSRIMKINYDETDAQLLVRVAEARSSNTESGSERDTRTIVEMNYDLADALRPVLQTGDYLLVWGGRHKTVSPRSGGVSVIMLNEEDSEGHEFIIHYRHSLNLEFSLPVADLTHFQRTNFIHTHFEGGSSEDITHVQQVLPRKSSIVSPWKVVSSTDGSEPQGQGSSTPQRGSTLRESFSISKGDSTSAMKTPRLSITSSPSTSRRNTATPATSVPSISSLSTNGKKVVLVKTSSPATTGVVTTPMRERLSQVVEIDDRVRSVKTLGKGRQRVTSDDGEGSSEVGGFDEDDFSEQPEEVEDDTEDARSETSGGTIELVDLGDDSDEPNPKIPGQEVSDPTPKVTKAAQSTTKTDVTDDLTRNDGFYNAFIASLTSLDSGTPRSAAAVSTPPRNALHPPGFGTSTRSTSKASSMSVVSDGVFEAMDGMLGDLCGNEGKAETRVQSLKEQLEQFTASFNKSQTQLLTPQKSGTPSKGPGTSETPPKDVEEAIWTQMNEMFSDEGDEVAPPPRKTLLVKTSPSGDPTSQGTDSTRMPTSASSSPSIYSDALSTSQTSQILGDETRYQTFTEEAEAFFLETSRKSSLTTVHTISDDVINKDVEFEPLSDDEHSMSSNYSFSDFTERGLVQFFDLDPNEKTLFNVSCNILNLVPARRSGTEFYLRVDDGTVPCFSPKRFITQKGSSNDGKSLEVAPPKASHVDICVRQGGDLFAAAQKNIGKLVTLNNVALEHDRRKGFYYFLMTGSISFIHLDGSPPKQFGEPEKSKMDNTKDYLNRNVLQSKRRRNMEPVEESDSSDSEKSVLSHLCSESDSKDKFPSTHKSPKKTTTKKENIKTPTSNAKSKSAGKSASKSSAALKINSTPPVTQKSASAKKSSTTTKATSSRSRKYTPGTRGRENSESVQKSTRQSEKATDKVPRNKTKDQFTPDDVASTRSTPPSQTQTARRKLDFQEQSDKAGIPKRIGSPLILRKRFQRMYEKRAEQNQGRGQSIFPASRLARLQRQRQAKVHNVTHASGSEIETAPEIIDGEEEPNAEQPTSSAGAQEENIVEGSRKLRRRSHERQKESPITSDNRKSRSQGRVSESPTKPTPRKGSAQGRESESPPKPTPRKGSAQERESESPPKRTPRKGSAQGRESESPSTPTPRKGSAQGRVSESPPKPTTRKSSAQERTLESLPKTAKISIPKYVKEIPFTIRLPTPPDLRSKRRRSDSATTDPIESEHEEGESAAPEESAKGKKSLVQMKKRRVAVSEPFTESESEQRSQSPPPKAPSPAPSSSPEIIEIIVPDVTPKPARKFASKIASKPKQSGTGKKSPKSPKGTPIRRVGRPLKIGKKLTPKSPVKTPVKSPIKSAGLARKGLRVRMKR